MIIEKSRLYAQLKNKEFKDNHTPFLKRELNKTIKNRSRLKNRSPEYTFREIPRFFKLGKKFGTNLTKYYFKANKQRFLEGNTSISDKNIENNNKKIYIQKHRGKMTSLP